jgi:translation initiation factor 3 subunit C
VKKETAVVVAKKVVKKAPNKVQKKILEEKATAVLNANAAKVAKAQWKLEDNITEELLEKKLTDLVAARGRKRSDIKSVLRQLEVLSKMAVYFGPRKEILTLMHRVSAMFDSHRLIDDFMDLETWRNCHACMTKVLVVLHANPKLVLALINPEDAAVVNLSNVKAVEVDSSKTTDGNILRIVGSIESFLIRLQDEYTKGLQQINPHTQVSDLIFKVI